MVDIPIKTILLTGSSGFIGEYFCKEYNQHYTLKKVSLRNHKIKEINFDGVNTIVHLAGIAHRMEEIDNSIYYKVNYELTKEFAEAAKKNGIQHFIFFSTIKVYGKNTSDNVLSIDSPCMPEDDYGKSKRMAEEHLIKMEDTDFKVTIIRPPLVYGPGVKGNLINLLKIADKKIPLPLSGIKNKRSMVFLGNLIALTKKIIDTRSNGIFHPTDEQPISTTDLIKDIRLNFGRSSMLFSLPPFARLLLKKMKPEIYNRLFGDLIIDSVSTQKKLDFSPPYTTQAGIKQMVDWFKNISHS